MNDLLMLKAMIMILWSLQVVGVVLVVAYCVYTEWKD